MVNHAPMSAITPTTSAAMPCLRWIFVLWAAWPGKNEGNLSAGSAEVHDRDHEQQHAEDHENRGYPCRCVSGRRTSLGHSDNLSGEPSVAHRLPAGWHETGHRASRRSLFLVEAGVGEAGRAARFPTPFGPGAGLRPR